MNEKMKAWRVANTHSETPGHFSERRRGALGWDHVQFDTLVRERQQFIHCFPRHPILDRVGSTVYAVLRGQEEREECLTAGMQRALGERHEQGL